MIDWLVISMNHNVKSLVVLILSTIGYFFVQISVVATVLSIGLEEYHYGSENI